MNDKVIIFADGGCRGNGEKNNVGGWGAVLTHGQHYKTLKGNAVNTTNNIMELTSAIQALEAIKNNKYPIEVYMDSAYVVNGITQWVPNWIENNWQTKSKQPVKNKELWQRLYELKCNVGFVTFFKVKGHNGILLNERADQLANEAMDELSALLKTNKQNGGIY